MKNTDSSNRQLKVANLIKLSLIDVLQKGKQLDIKLIENKITVTRVTVSPDLKLATCYYLPFGNNPKPKEIQEALDSSKFAIRRQITETVNLKYSPEIRFLYDHGVENASEVEAAIMKALYKGDL